MFGSAALLAVLAAALLVLAQTVSPGAINGTIGLGLAAFACLAFAVFDER